MSHKERKYIMSNVYVSRYANRELRTGEYTAVRISLGMPRWPLGYELAGEIKDLMPVGMKNIMDIEKFRPLYYRRLDGFGFARIEAQIQKFLAYGKPVALLCYEDIRKGPHNWCHRTIFADWWLKETDERIVELRDDSKFVPEPGFETEKTSKVSEVSPSPLFIETALF